ncbi:helix-turn-helix domain-containing protein [Staphylococcus equorum]|uniref:helix-turn-helix domain-containing protein n=1 Tax=Staphylococcus equorum TaxID=246432 RepID=UPI001F2397BE|nr:helix-turn-helix transcriptional regulator [Staphylococcus equorum]MCE5006748.1 helix-turn-helix transcriptional regulator [Staphylococcus equorum]
MNEFGEKIKELRGNQSLREAAKNVGISHTYLDSLEKGFDPRSGKERKPTSEIVGKLANYYNYSYFDLMKLAGNFVPLRDLSEDEIKRQFKYLTEELRSQGKDKENRIKKSLLSLVDRNLSFTEIHYLSNILKFLKYCDSSDVLSVSVLISHLYNHKDVKNSDDFNNQDTEKIYTDTMDEFGKLLKEYLGLEKNK